MRHRFLFTQGECCLNKKKKGKSKSNRRLWTAVEELSENELRIQVIIPLLRATPGVSSVTDVHGQNERGLDVIFFVESAIEELCYGLQLKKSSISGGGTGGRKVKDIVDQLELADDFEHPIATKNAGTHKMDKYVVCTSGTISNMARDEIPRRIKKIPVLFWDRDELIRRIHQHLPQLFQISDGGVIEYLKTVLQRVEALDSLDQIPGVAKRTLSQVFVEPHLRRKFDPYVGEASAEKTGVSTGSAVDVLLKCNRGVLIAEQDGGKTAVLRMCIIRRIQDMLNGQDDVKEIPVFIQAKDILATEDGVKDSVVMKLKVMNGECLVESIEEDLLAGQYFIAIDGFSEFLHEEDKDLVVSLIEQFCENYPDTSVVVAARPVDFLRAKYFPKFFQYTIEDFSPEQVTSLVRAWTGNSNTYADVAEKMVDRLREALQLPGSPIPAMIGVMLHEEQGRFITNTAEAIDRYMVIRLGRYAHELGMKQEIDWARKQDLLAEIAFEMVCQEQDSLSREEIVDGFNTIYKRQGEDNKGEIALNEMLDSGILVSDGEQFGFHRTSFRDFFAAHHLVQRGDFEEFAIEKLYARNWGGVLVFAAGLRRRNSQILTQIVGTIDELRVLAVGELGDDYYYASYLCGRVLSNSETADNDPRVLALRTFLRGANDSLPILEGLATEQFGKIGHLMALVGIEHTVFTTIGVPWLQNQFKEMLKDSELHEEERYILASTYAHLGYSDAFQVLQSIARDFHTTRAIFALNLLVEQLEQRKIPTGEEARALKVVKTHIRRRLSTRKAQVRALLEVKSKALEVERGRIKRLLSKSRRKK